NSEAAKVLSDAGIRRKDGSPFALTVLPDDTLIAPGTVSESGVKRAASSDVLRIVEACRNAYSGQSPEELAYAATQIFGTGVAFTNADVRLFQKVLNGAKNATPEQREYADKIYSVLARETDAVRTKKKTAKNSYGASSAEVYDRQMKEAYFKELEKFYDFCTEFNLGLAEKGSSFRAEIERRFTEIDRAITNGAAWDKRLSMLESMNVSLGLLPGRTKTVKYKTKE
ncbi:MAG: hypothetical protein IJX22_01915, partial [Opitutales bacterium]|nr:hypothetical protein [Opitutales bacterium]